ncbi:DUF5959 family protein [Streptomyces griseoluteus]|uniref:DUF5959 family protein n=1 Tax=Streptomyces griseoluteus TaxID=29306 RepID=UPI00343F778F
MDRKHPKEYGEVRARDMKPAEARAGLREDASSPHLQETECPMTGPAPVDLIHLEDADGNRCIVRVTGRFQPGILTGHDILRADVLVSASFIDARLDVLLFQRDLDAWQQDLADLVPGRQAGVGGDRGLSLTLHMHEDGWLSVTVEDPDRLTAVLGIRPDENWVHQHQEDLQRVRQTWPSEVIETAPGAYQWCPDRKR